MARKLLRDDQWRRIEHWLPGKNSDPGRSAADNRLFVEAVLWNAHTGAPWRELPPEFRPWDSVYKCFSLWKGRGLWHCVFEELVQDADFEDLYLDSTVVRARQHTARAARKTVHKRSGGGLGQMARWSLTPGQRHDITEASALIEGLCAEVVVADKAYDADAFLADIERSSAEALIPLRTNRSDPRRFDRHRYQDRDRHLVERFFCRMKHFRRIATRYEKLASRSSTFVALMAAFLWLA